MKPGRGAVGVSPSGAAVFRRSFAMRDRIEELEGLLGLKLQKPRTLAGVRATGWRLLGLLYRREVVTREFAFAALYGGRPEAEQPGDIRVIDQHACRLNKALAPHGVRIRAEIGTGYFLDRNSRLRLRQIMEKDQTIC